MEDIKQTPRKIKRQMGYTNKRITICERVRELNDLHQSDTEHDKIVREKLIEIEYMAKRMVHKLYEYKSAKEIKNELFPGKNKNYRESRKKRKEKDYKIGN